MIRARFTIFLIVASIMIASCGGVPGENGNYAHVTCYHDSGKIIFDEEVFVSAAGSYRKIDNNGELLPEKFYMSNDFDCIEMYYEAD
jgi:hypothetical protein